MTRSGFRPRMCLKELKPLFAITLLASIVSPAGVCRSEEPQLVKQITGIVLTPEGKPAAGAKVALVATVFSWESPSQRGERLELVADGHTKSDGRFDLRWVKLPDAQINAVYLVAGGPEFAIVWARPNFDDPQQDYELQLSPPRDLRGTLLDADGKPLVDAAVRLTSLTKNHPMEAFSLGNDALALKELFPTEFKTDPQGQILVRGLPPAVGVAFRLMGSDHLSLSFTWKPDAADQVYRLPQTFTIFGMVTASDTGRAIANAIVTAHDTRTETDAAGSFQLKSASVIGGSFHNLRSTAGRLCVFAAHDVCRRHADARQENVQLQLDPAVLVTGQIIEEGSGEPVANARIVCETRYDSKVFGYIGGFVATSDTDGKFSFAARPGTLDVSVEGCSCDFQMQPVQAERQVSPTKSIFTPENVFAHATMEVSPGAEGEVKLVVRRGVTVAGEIVGSNGKVPAEVTMRHAFPQYSGFTDNYRFSVYIRHGHFAIHGVPQNGDFPVVFFDAAGDEGKYLFCALRHRGRPECVEALNAEWGSANGRLLLCYITGGATKTRRREST